MKMSLRSIEPSPDATHASCYYINNRPNQTKPNQEEGYRGWSGSEAMMKALNHLSSGNCYAHWLKRNILDNHFRAATASYYVRL
jgi:hypothetical protein